MSTFAPDDLPEVEEIITRIVELKERPTMTEQLKPCPFCGASAELRTKFDDETPKTWTEVRCSAICNFSDTPRMGSHEGVQHTIRRWNSRAIPSTHRVVSVELLRRIIDGAYMLNDLKEELRAIIDTPSDS